MIVDIHCMLKENQLQFMCYHQFSMIL